MVESPRGELLHCADIRNGDIWRYSIRDPSFVNWPALELAVMGNIVPDFPMINKSFGLSYSGNDV
jgi:Ni,Fe-hydrogenase III large subunit